MNTPMMEQYLSLKQEHQDEVLFFRLGDFYEMFLDDAKEVSRLLNITLTARNGIPMCGIPYHAAKNYIKRLLDAGKKIAICEQVEMSGPNRSIARREVVQVITVGTVVEDEFLDASSNNHILCIALQDREISCAYSEISSGTMYLVTIPKDDRFESLRSLFEEISPKEILVNEDDYFSHGAYGTLVDQSEAVKTRLPSWYFGLNQAASMLTEHFETKTLKQFGIGDDDPVLAPAGALFRYISDTAKTSLSHIDTLLRIDRGAHLLIDESSRKNLELLRNLQDGSSQRTLFSALNKTCTSAGSRLLKSWIATPLASMEAIAGRQEWVGWFLAEERERQRVRTLLGDLKDLSRLATRVSMRRAIPQDLLAITHAIATFFELTTHHADRYRILLGRHLDDARMTLLVSLMETLLCAIDGEVQGPFSGGSVIKEGYSEELDRFRTLMDGGASQLSGYVTRLKEETGIPTMKLSSNRIIGHYLEIPKTHGSKVPDRFYRKQTLVNAERYTTDELMALESEILAATERAEKLERELYEQLLVKTASLTSDLLALGEFFATVDCLQSFAQVAHLEQYCKPLVVSADVLVITDGRHPVVEQHMARGQFVANGLSMDEGEDRFCLITGPNMAGKSTYLRQNALIVLMAHIGSYVSARSATIGLTDRLYCRVGSSDNLARGESTFLIEMQEAAYILRTATNRSLAIMDEIGRGTSTQDGMSIAYAVMRAMTTMQVKTLFATHYHELTMLNTEGMQLLTLAVAETKRSVTFLRKVQKGVANSSYGLHVARMAGMPSHVIRDAANFQRQHFADYALAGNALQLDLFTKGDTLVPPVDPPLCTEVCARIADFPLDESTPLQAMRFIESLKEELENGS